MTIDALAADGYKLQALSIATIHGERTLSIILSKRSGNRVYKYVSAAPVSEKTLREANFTIPILREGK